jgi:protein phosphatase
VKIELPELSLVVLIGPSGSGKSTFAGRHFASTEVQSSDACRALVGDDENDQRVTRQAFEVLHFIAGKRLALGRLRWSMPRTFSRSPGSPWSGWPASTTSSR